MKRVGEIEEFSGGREIVLQSRRSETRKIRRKLSDEVKLITPKL